MTNFDQRHQRVNQQYNADQITINQYDSKHQKPDFPEINTKAVNFISLSSIFLLCISPIRPVLRSFIAPELSNDSYSTGVTGAALYFLIHIIIYFLMPPIWHLVTRGKNSWNLRHCSGFFLLFLLVTIGEIWYRTNVTTNLNVHLAPNIYPVWGLLWGVLMGTIAWVIPIVVVGLPTGIILWLLGFLPRDYLFSD